MQENNIVIIKKQTHETVDFNNDYSLPDYIVDVQKLVSCEAKAVLQNIYCTDNKFIFEGEITYSILVICEDNSIKNLIYSEDFSVNGDAVGCMASVHDCKLESVVARLVSPRKLNCRSKIVVTTMNNVEENTSAIYCGTGLPEAEYTIEKKTETCRYLTFFDENQQNQHASRDIELTSTRDEISNIVYCRVNICITERKISDGKLLLRGETVSEILYESLNGNYVKHIDRALFSDVVEKQNEATAHLCEVNVSDIKASVRNNSFGEMKVIELDYTYGIRCRGYIENEVDMLRDIYSTEYDVECMYNSVSAMNLNTLFSASLSVNDSCGAEELGDEGIIDIVDHNVSVLGVNIKAEPLNRRVVVTGELKFDILYKAEEYGYHTVIRPFKYEREYDGAKEDVYCERSVSAQSVACVIDKGRLILNAEVYLNIMIAEPISYEYIEKAEFANCCSDNKSPVIIYYPNKDDTIWDIAKKYKTTCKDIINANFLSSDSLDGVKVLLLPKKKQRSVFNAII